MSVKGSIARDRSTLHRARFGKTSLSVFTTTGIGGVMIAKQLCTTFVRHCEVAGDPRLGDIVITAGAWPTSFRMDKGGHNIYWGWSMNGQDDWLDSYTAKARVKPDVIACLPEGCIQYGQGRGLKTAYLPLAVGEYFQASNSGREGIGFAGSRGHKDEAQTGMVNNRVFEALATGRPFIIHRHRALEQVPECPYPYQAGSAEETRKLADEILEDYPRHQAAFERYRQLVYSRHTYRHRIETLPKFLQARR